MTDPPALCDRIEALMREATPGPMSMLAGQGWPEGWADVTGIHGQGIVWPVQPSSEPVPGGKIHAVFRDACDQRRYVETIAVLPALLRAARENVLLRRRLDALLGAIELGEFGEGWGPNMRDALADDAWLKGTE